MAVHAVNAEEAYQRYCAWCARLGITPAPREVWARVSGGVPHGYGELAREQKQAAK